MRLRQHLPPLALALLAAGSAAAAVRDVCSSGCTYPTIQAAVDAAVAGDTVSILDAFHTEGDIVVSKDLTIAGAGSPPPRVQASTTNGSAADRVLTIVANAEVTLRDLVIRHGRVQAGNGGGILNHGELTLVGVAVEYNEAESGWGGGIWSDGPVNLRDSSVSVNQAEGRGGGIACVGFCTLTATDTTLDGNSAGNGGAGDGGGGVYTEGSSSLTDSLVVGNQVFGLEPAGGGILHTGSLLLVRTDLLDNVSTAYGGGISSRGALTVVGSTIADNLASAGFPGIGGGLELDGAGTALVHSSIFEGNRAFAYGGAVFHNGQSLNVYDSSFTGSQTDTAAGGLAILGPAVIEGSLIAGSSTPGEAGGVYVEGVLRLRRSTVSGNASDSNGGGIYVAVGGELSLSNVTVTDNDGDLDGDSGANGGGLYVEAGGLVEVRNSIIAGNRDPGPVVLAQATDCAGAITNDGFLHIGSLGLAGLDPACVVSGAAAEVGGAAGLDPLADNGGPTMTHPLTIGSLNIDAGDPTGCRDGFGQVLAGDQRGAPYSNTCDRGAFEWASEPPIFASGFEAGGPWRWTAVVAP